MCASSRLPKYSMPTNFVSRSRCRAASTACRSGCRSSHVELTKTRTMGSCIQWNLLPGPRYKAQTQHYHVGFGSVSVARFWLPGGCRRCTMCSILPPMKRRQSRYTTGIEERMQTTPCRSVHDSLAEYRKNKATFHASPPAPPRTRPCPYWELSPAAPARQRLARSVDRRQAVRRPRREPRRAAKVQACHGARQKGWCKGLGLSLARRRLGQTSGRLQPPSTGGGALTLRGENADVHREARRKLAHYWRGDAIIADHNIAKIGGGRSTRPVASPPHPATVVSCGRGVEAFVLAILDGSHALYKVGPRLEERGLLPLLCRPGHTARVPA